MKTRIYILTGIAALLAMVSCEPKSEYLADSFVMMDATSVSIDENDPTGVVTVLVRAYPLSGEADTKVSFEVTDGEGDNGAKAGEDYNLVSPLNGILEFSGNDTAAISFSISDAFVGVYTGRKNFRVALTGTTNGYSVGAAYFTTVYINDSDKDPNPGLPGTYSASGPAYVSSGVVGDATWEVKIFESDNPLIYYIDGLVPLTVGWYDQYGSAAAATCYMNDAETQLIVPSQVIGVTLDEYYLGYTPCTAFSNGSFSYSSSWPDLTFTKDSSTGDWTSTYGVFLVGMSSASLNYWLGFYDVVAPSITLTKIE